MVLSFNAASPIAVLKLPVVSLKSACVPKAVFPAKSGASDTVRERLKTEGRVAVAGGVGTESERSIGRV